MKVDWEDSRFSVQIIILSVALMALIALIGEISGYYTVEFLEYIKFIVVGTVTVPILMVLMFVDWKVVKKPFFLLLAIITVSLIFDGTFYRAYNLSFVGITYTTSLPTSHHFQTGINAAGMYELTTILYRYGVWLSGFLIAVCALDVINILRMKMMDMKEEEHKNAARQQLTSLVNRE